jgi:two-component system response regulator (stage 0 sporulation protein F)
MSGKKVLIVDDEEGIAQFMKDMFERKGCKAFTATDTEAALEIFKRDAPDVCILDVHMPFSKFDGIELLRKIKDIDKNPVCVMISRIDDIEKVNEAKRLGASKYLFKPLEIEALHGLINTLSL